jgi:hypothetical protein
MSTLKTNKIQHLTSGFNNVVQFVDGAGTENGTLCRAWVNFNGTGTVAIRASFNVSSITDNGTGLYTVNFTNAMSDANYSTMAQCIACGIVAGLYVEVTGTTACGTPTTSSTALRTITSGGTTYDSNYVYASVFR